MKLIFFILTIFFIFSSPAHAEIAPYAKQGITIAKEIAQANLTLEWVSKLSEHFLEIAKFTRPFAKFAGPAGELLVLVLMFTDEHSKSDTKEHLTNFTNKLDVVSKEVRILDYVS
jgi:hypothetical protein